MHNKLFSTVLPLNNSTACVSYPRDLVEEAAAKRVLFYSRVNINNYKSFNLIEAELNVNIPNFYCDREQVA